MDCFMAFHSVYTKVFKKTFFFKLFAGFQTEDFYAKN